jgi:hypothetical protein
MIWLAAFGSGHKAFSHAWSAAPLPLTLPVFLLDAGGWRPAVPGKVLFGTQAQVPFGARFD